MATYTGRNARVADRSDHKYASPFRASKDTIRIAAGKRMVAQREQELAHLQVMLESAETPKMTRIITARIVASVNNKDSWLDYLREAEREASAVIIPR